MSSVVVNCWINTSNATPYEMAVAGKVSVPLRLRIRLPRLTAAALDWRLQSLDSSACWTACKTS